METLRLLETRIRRTAIQDALVAGVVLVLALLVAAATVSLAMTAVNGRTMMMGVFSLAFLWAAWAMAQSARALWPARSSRIYVELSTEGNHIAWVHLTTGAFSAIKVYFLDGDEFTLFASKRDAEALLAFVEERAPDAVVGFGAEQLAAYVALVNQWRASQAAPTA